MPPMTPSIAPSITRGGALRCKGEEFTDVQRMRAEVESPFAQVRLFLLPALLGAALIATYFGGTALLASSLGLREGSSSQFTDLAIDLGSVGTLGFLWRREIQVRDARLKRIAFGGRVAALRVSLLAFDGASSLGGGREVCLADLRRGRGQARRVVIVCAPQETLRGALDVASNSAGALSASDFLIVPLVASGTASSPTLTPASMDLLQEVASASASSALVGEAVASSALTQPPLPWDAAVQDASGGWPVALPQPGAWAAALAPELEQAARQDATILQRGLTIILKKNGRVGTRRLGMPDWDALIADVSERKRAGLDVVNI